MIVEIVCCECGHFGKVWVTDVGTLLTPICKECEAHYEYPVEETRGNEEENGETS